MAETLCWKYLLPIQVEVVTLKSGFFSSTSDLNPLQEKIVSSQFLPNQSQKHDVPNMQASKHAYQACVPGLSAQSALDQLFQVDERLRKDDPSPSPHEESLTRLLPEAQSHDQYTTLFEFLLSYEECLKFACVTGFLHLSPQASLKESHPTVYSEYNRYYYWMYFMYAGILLFPIVSIVVLIATNLAIYNDTKLSTIEISEMICSLLQNLLLFPLLAKIRQSLFRKRNQFYLKQYLQCFLDGIQSSYRIISVLNIFTLILLGMIIATSPPIYIPTFVIGCISFFVSNYLLVGIYHFINFEQKLSLLRLQQFENKLQQQIATRNEYLELFHEMNERNAYLPINLFLLVTFFNTVFAVVVIWILAGVSTTSFTLIALTLFIVTIAYGRETMLLVFLLWKILQINSLPSKMISDISLEYWPDEDSHSNPSVADIENSPSLSRKTMMVASSSYLHPPQKLIGNETGRDNLHNHDYERMMLYLMLREKPFGTKILSFRLSKWQLLTQIISLVVTFSIVILRVLIVANLS